MDNLTPLEAAEKKIARCNDCGMPYGESDWVDTVLSNEQWDLIFPEHDGLLCANCIAKRAQKLGAISIFAKINFSGDYNKIAAGEYRQVVRCKNCEYWNNDGVHLTGICSNVNVGKIKLDTDFCSFGERKDGAE